MFSPIKIFQNAVKSKSMPVALIGLLFYARSIMDNIVKKDSIVSEKQFLVRRRTKIVYNSFLDLQYDLFYR